MISFSHATIYGNAAGKPELRFTPSGQPTCRVRVAVDTVWKDKEGERQKKVDWFTVICWGRLAETTAEWVKRGTRVLVDGRLQTRVHENREYTEIVARDLQFENVVKSDNANDRAPEEVEIPPPPPAEDVIPF